MQESEHHDIVMWHGAIREFCGFPMESALPLADIPTGKCILLAMGVFHVTNDLELSDGSPVIYPGSTELCSASEEPQKNVYYYEFVGGKLTHKEVVPIHTRKALFFRINNENDVVDAIAQIEKAAGSKPIIIVRYDRTVPSVVNRLRVVTPQDCILRTAPLAAINIHAPLTPSATSDKVMADFLGDYITEGTDLYELGLQMLDPEAAALEALSTYIEKTLNKVIV
jgi:DNA repair exonuclease SbcCD nuclease subunit